MCKWLLTCDLRHPYIGVTQNMTPEFLQACTHKLRFLCAATRTFLSLLLPLASCKRLGSKHYNLMQLQASVTYEANTRKVSYKKADDLTCFRSYSHLPSRLSFPPRISALPNRGVNGGYAVAGDLY